MTLTIWLAGLYRCDVLERVRKGVSRRCYESIGIHCILYTPELPLQSHGEGLKGHFSLRYESISVLSMARL